MKIMLKNKGARGTSKKNVRLTGAVIAAVAGMAFSQSARATTLYWDPSGTSGLGGGGNWDTTSTSWTTDPTAATGQQTYINSSSSAITAYFGGSSAGTVSLSNPISVNALTFNTSGYTISGSTLNLTGTGPNVISTGSGLTETIGSILASGNGVTFSGAGQVTLNAYETYTGLTTVNSGTLVLGVGGGQGTLKGNIIINAGATVSAAAGDALGYNVGYSPAMIAINGGTFYDAANLNEGYTTSFNLSGGTISSSGGAINFNGGFGVNQLASNTTSVISAPINVRGSAVFFNTSKGTTSSGIDLSITGAMPNYGSGFGTIIQGTGTTQLTGANGNTGSAQFSGGTVDLGTGVTFSSSAPLVLSGVAMNSAATGNLTFASTTVNTQGLGGGTLFLDTASNTIAFKTFTRTVGSTLDLNGSSATYTTTSANTNGIIGGWLTVGGGANFGSIQGGSIVGLPSTDPTYITTTTAGNTSSGYALMNVDVNSSQSIGTAIGANSLRFNTPGNYTLTLPTGSSSLASGGILVTPSFGANTANISGGTLWGPAAGDLIINNYDSTPGGSLVIASVLANSSTGSTLTVSGTGTTILTGANTYAGPTYVNGGTLVVKNKATADSNYYVAAGATLELGYNSISTGYSQTITLNGNNSSTPSLAVAGGVKYDINSGLSIQSGPATLSSYGSGVAYLYAFDTNSAQISVAQASSGSVVTGSLELALAQYGLDITTTAGANNATGDLVVNTPIVNNGQNGSSNLFKKGNGSLMLTAVNTYGYTTNIQGGSIILSGAGQLPTADPLVLGTGSASASLVLTGVSQQLPSITVSGTGTANSVVNSGSVASNLTLAISSATVDSFNGVLGGSGTNQNLLSLTKIGAGILQLGGTNTYANGTFISAGVLSFTSSSAIPGYVSSVSTGASSINVASGATLAVGINTSTLAAAIPSIAANANFSSGSFFAIDTSSGSTIYSGGLPLPSGTALTTMGSNTTYLTGTNTFSGGISISVGTLEFASTSAFPGYTSSPDGAAVLSGGTLALAVGGTGQFQSSDIASVVANTGFVGGSALALDTASSANAAAGFTYPGVIFGSEGVTKLGVNTLILTASNTFSGNVIIKGGTLSLGNTGALASSSAGLYLNSGTLLVGTSNPAAPSFASTNASSGASTITNGSAATMGLGTLSHVAGASIDFGTGPITTSTTNNAYGIIGGWATQGGGASWATNSSNAAGGAITAYTGYVTTATAGTTAANYNASNIDVTTSVAPLALITPSTVRFNTNAATTLTLTGTNVFTSGGILVTPSVGAYTSNISGGVLEGANGADLVINQYNTNGALIISSLILNNTNATALTKSGPGTVTLTGTNAYTGGTFVNGGTLIEAGSAGFNVGVIHGTATVNAGAQMSWTGADMSTANDTVNVNGGGIFNVSNASAPGGSNALTYYLGTVNLNSFDGLAAVATTPDASTFRMGYNNNGLITSTGPVMNTDSQGIQLTNGGNYTFTATAAAGNTLLLSGSFIEYSGLTGMPVFFNGAGTTILTGTNTYVGTTTITNGTLQLGNGGSTGNLGTGPVVDNGTVAYKLSTAFTQPNTITGSGQLVQTGTSSLILAGTYSYSGSTNVSSGKLYVTGSFTGVGPFSVASGATLGGTSTIPGTVTVSSGGTIEAGMTGAGKLTVGGLVLNGSDNINFGTLANYSSTTGINVTGNGLLDPTGTVTINVSSVAGTSAGTYKLISYAGSIGGGGFSDFTLAGLPSRTSGTLINNPGEIDLTIGGSGSDYLVWTGASNLANGWDTTTTNWQLHSTGAPTTYVNSPSPDAVVFDDTASPSNTTVAINSTVTPSGLSFNNNSNNYILNGSAGISGSVALTMTGSGNVTINNSNSFTGGINMTGSGTLTLTNANTITGPITVGNGILNLQNSGALGTSSSMNVASGATVQLQGNITTGSVPTTLNGTGYGSQTGALVSVSGTNSYGGAIILAGSSTISVNSGSLTLSSTSAMTGTYGLTLTGPAGTTGTVTGPIGIGAGTITMNGLGTWTLNGADTLTGLTTVNSGTLIVNGDAGQSHSYTVAQGATLDLGYSSGGGYSGGITLNGNGLASSAGLYFKNGVTFYTNGDLYIQTAPTTINTYNTTGGVATIRGFDVNTGAFLTVASAASGSVTSSTINLNTGSYGFTLSTIPGANTSTGDLTIMGSIVGTGAATGGFSGGLYNGALNIIGGGSVLLTGTSTYSNGTDIQNGSIILAGGTNTLPATTYVQLGYGGFNGQLLLSGMSQQITGLYTAGSAGGSNAVLGNSATNSILTVNFSSFNNSGTISTTDTYSGVLGGGGTNQNNFSLVKTGTGTLTLTNSNNTYTGTTNVSAGTLVITTDGGLPYNSNVLINTGATLVSDSQYTISSTGLLNINGNVVVHNGNLQTLTASAQQAFSNGWNGTSGMISSAAVANSSHLTALGVIQNTLDQTTGGTALYNTFEGQSVTNSDVLIKYTYYGDANLDGKVDGSDYSLIDNSYEMEGWTSTGPTTMISGWYNGDFNYDGVVDGSDYTLIDNAFNSQGTQISAEIASPTAELAPGGGVSAVPEPTSLGLLGLGAIGLLGRRRRRA
jgi:fibronectin-binding autotransporter adhesin